jgi:hypothetical protein
METTRPETEGGVFPESVLKLYKQRVVQTEPKGNTDTGQQPP